MQVSRKGQPIVLQHLPNHILANLKLRQIYISYFYNIQSTWSFLSIHIKWGLTVPCMATTSPCICICICIFTYSKRQVLLGCILCASQGICKRESSLVCRKIPHFVSAGIFSSIFTVCGLIYLDILVILSGVPIKVFANERGTWRWAVTIVICIVCTMLWDISKIPLTNSILMN